jgi:hypothetical protein
MKSFTDIKQSKKLAEILPIKSADMWWLYITAQCKHIAMMHEEPDPNYLARMERYGMTDAAIPCWSLAALISILPRYLNYNDDKLRLNLYTLDFENLYRKDHCWIIGYWDYDEETEEYNFQIQAKENEVIDACYELILKLNERKLLN